MTALVPQRPMVWLARIRRPQGRKGEVFAEILTDFPDKFAERRKLWLIAEAKSSAGTRPASGTRDTTDLSPPREVELNHHWLHKGGVVLHFAGVDSITAAESLKGLIVAIPRAERAKLGEDETYISDLVGCTLVDVSGAEALEVGEIENVDRSAGPAPLLVVRGQRGEVLVPFAKSYLRRIDLAARHVEMALPEGLVDLNTPDKA